MSTELEGLEELDFSLSMACEFFYLRKNGNFERCEDPAFCLVKVKCEKCEQTVSHYCCIDCLSGIVKSGTKHNYKPGGCHGRAWYVTHVGIK